MLRNVSYLVLWKTLRVFPVLKSEDLFLINNYC